VSTSLSRVTIVAPRTHLDVALPADVPLIDLLPTLLDLAGGATDEAARRDGWSLSRLDSGELDSSRTPAQLKVYDGEVLFLRPRGDETSVTVFDDVVDALADGAAEGRGRWTPAHSRTAALVLGLAMLSAGVIALPFLGPPFAAAGLAGLGVAVAALLVAVVFSRALGRGGVASAFAVVATAYAVVGGLLVAAGSRPLSDLTPAHLVVAATTAVLVAVLASIGVPAAAPILLAVAACVVASLAVVGGSAWLDTPVAGAAALVAVIAYATLPALPMLAYRMAGLPRPTVPTGRESLQQTEEPVDGVRVAELGRRADTMLSAMLAALGAIGAAAAVAVSRAGVAGLALAAVLAALPILRSRWFGRRAHRIPLLAAGGAALAAALASGFTLIGPDARVAAVAIGAAVVALACVGVGLAGDRPPSPRWGRLGDVVEMLLILAMAPLAVWVSGLLEVVRAIRG
jgi:type VII secretion integral membrane protein EccD